MVARPTLDIKEANDDKVVMAFNCVVSPEVTLGDYKGLDIHKEEVEVTEEDINAEVERIQNRYADWVIREEDEEAQLKDQVTIDFVGEKMALPLKVDLVKTILWNWDQEHSFQDLKNSLLV